MAKNGKRLGFLPDWRIFTYVILVINLIFLIWIIAGANSGNDTKNCGSLSAKACQDASNIGKGIGISLIIILWVIADIILGILWLITNRKKRDCPVCGHSVKKGQMQCRSCGHDFRQQYQQQQYQQQQYQPPQQQYPQQQQQAHPHPHPQPQQPQPQPQPQQQPQQQQQPPTGWSYSPPNPDPSGTTRPRPGA